MSQRLLRGQPLDPAPQVAGLGVHAILGGGGVVFCGGVWVGVVGGEGGAPAFPPAGGGGVRVCVD